MPAQATRSGTDRRQTPAISRRVCLHSEKKDCYCDQYKGATKGSKARQYHHKNMPLQCYHVGFR